MKRFKYVALLLVLILALTGCDSLTVNKVDPITQVDAGYQTQLNPQPVPGEDKVIMADETIPLEFDGPTWQELRLMYGLGVAPTQAPPGIELVEVITPIPQLDTTGHLETAAVEDPIVCSDDNEYILLKGKWYRTDENHKVKAHVNSKASALNFRSGPSTKNTIYTSFGTNTVIYISRAAHMSDGSTWYAVTTEDGRDGWQHSYYIDIDSSIKTKPNSVEIPSLVQYEEVIVDPGTPPIWDYTGKLTLTDYIEYEEPITKSVTKKAILWDGANYMNGKLTNINVGDEVQVLASGLMSDNKLWYKVNYVTKDGDLVGYLMDGYIDNEDLAVPTLEPTATPTPRPTATPAPTPVPVGPEIGGEVTRPTSTPRPTPTYIEITDRPTATPTPSAKVTATPTMPEGRVCAPFSSDLFVNNESYYQKEVVKKFKKAGFTNVTTQSVYYDKNIGQPEGLVQKVSISGSESFTNTTYYWDDALVIVYYYTREEITVTPTPIITAAPTPTAKPENGKLYAPYDNTDFSSQYVDYFKDDVAREFRNTGFTNITYEETPFDPKVKQPEGLVYKVEIAGNAGFSKNSSVFYKDSEVKIYYYARKIIATPTPIAIDDDIDKVYSPFDSSMFTSDPSKSNYLVDSIAAEFRKAGFTNVVSKSQYYDLSVGQPDGLVAYVTISGTTGFTTESKFYKDAEVVITYYTRYPVMPCSSDDVTKYTRAQLKQMFVTNHFNEKNVEIFGEDNENATGVFIQQSNGSGSGYYWFVKDSSIVYTGNPKTTTNYSTYTVTANTTKIIIY